ncbi:hypothetical protein AAG570_012500 [Ranatra chinensis]|uniref:Farnesoic acid O-methyl transferase domain-containing protein n=1 Tax=Ranatra chinensis TaxID=642074 RepID=A0ABD0YE12_9HEMI
MAISRNRFRTSNLRESKKGRFPGFIGDNIVRYDGGWWSTSTGVRSLTWRSAHLLHVHPNLRTQALYPISPLVIGVCLGPRIALPFEMVGRGLGQVGWRSGGVAEWAGRASHQAAHNCANRSNPFCQVPPATQQTHFSSLLPQISTEDKLEYKFFPVDGKFISFKVKANNDAHVALTTAPSEGSPMYEVFIGGWGNSKYALRKNKEKPELAAVDSANILDSNEYKEFWICWRGGNISLGGSIDDPNPILSWTEPSPFNITHFGVRTGWGATGHWIVDETARPKPRYSWVPTTGSSIPPNALPGGFDNEQILIGRATHKGSVTPGKVIPSHGVCYVSWGGSEHGISEYEVYIRNVRRASERVLKKKNFNSERGYNHNCSKYTDCRGLCPRLNNTFIVGKQP